MVSTRRGGDSVDSKEVLKGDLPPAAAPGSGGSAQNISFRRSGRARKREHTELQEDVQEAVPEARRPRSSKASPIKAASAAVEPHEAPDAQIQHAQPHQITSREQRMLARQQQIEALEAEQDRDASDEEEEAAAAGKHPPERRASRRLNAYQRTLPTPLPGPALRGNRLLDDGPHRDPDDDDDDESSSSQSEEELMGDAEEEVDLGALQRAKLRHRPEPVNTAVTRINPPWHSQPARHREPRKRIRAVFKRRRQYEPASDVDAEPDPLKGWRQLQGRGSGPPVPYGAGGGSPAPRYPSTPQHLPASGLNPSAWAGPQGQAQWRQANPEVTPVQVDTSVTFGEVGGLDHYVRALKEMVFLPLVYPHLFERFQVAPPRGVLFYGPPGTGKTLVARALAASASRAGRPVTFFMRKGADILSKWVGEAERQLRALFAEAQRCQPSIIFFDEIDGLAPARSSRQDQIHNSIVSTLLALMDGLDARGQVVIVGATNRIDALDDALRRPGRFDRELLFPLPNLAARQTILDIHTRRWAQPPTSDLREELASLCVGYCGADLKALCTEASLQALRRSYPQIYETDDNLLVDPASVRVLRQDFMAAHQGIVPAAHRQAASHARPLPDLVRPALQTYLKQVLEQLRNSFPAAATCLALAEKEEEGLRAGDLALPHTESAAVTDFGSIGASKGSSANLLASSHSKVLLTGQQGAGQHYLAAAVLHALEGLPVHSLALPSLLADGSSRSAEEALVHIIVEAQRSAPCILYLPHLQLWWGTAPPTLRATLWMLLSDLPSTSPMALLGTCDCPLQELDPEALELFGLEAEPLFSGGIEISAPEATARREMFDAVADALALPVQPEMAAAQMPPPPRLPKAPDAEAASAAARAAAVEAARQQQQAMDVEAVRSLRMKLRSILSSLLGRRKYQMFAVPPDPDDADFWQKVSAPMDLSTMLARLNGGHYPTAQLFETDLCLIATTAHQRWQDDPSYAQDVGDAHELVDEARQAVTAIPPDLRRHCEDVEGRGGAEGQRPADLDWALQHQAGSGQRARILPPGRNVRQLHTAAGGAIPTGRSTRHGDRASDEGPTSNLLHEDPEMVIRRSREQQRQRQRQLDLVSAQVSAPAEAATSPPEDLAAPATAHQQAEPSAAAPCNGNQADAGLETISELPPAFDDVLPMPSPGEAQEMAAAMHPAQGLANGHAEPLLQAHPAGDDRQGVSPVAAANGNALAGAAVLMQTPAAHAAKAAHGLTTDRSRHGRLERGGALLTPDSHTGETPTGPNGVAQQPVRVSPTFRAGSTPYHAPTASLHTTSSSLFANGQPAGDAYTPASEGLARPSRFALLHGVTASAGKGLTPAGAAAAAAQQASQQGLQAVMTPSLEVHASDTPRGTSQSVAVSREGQYVNGGMHSTSGPAPLEAATPSTIPLQTAGPEALSVMARPHIDGQRPEADSAVQHDAEDVDVPLPASTLEAVQPAVQPSADDLQRAEQLKDAIVAGTEGLLLQQLERLHAALARVHAQHRNTCDRSTGVAAALSCLALCCKSPA
ncbi:hypothetical protein WJX73_003943 [Symbiochloris irregularis]|uniref:Bromo domain-containing protein n=1 Tax=Symbiochloris irregularis TaxID=706552 RepID=A0AAW1PVD3_9CHLO